AFIDEVARNFATLVEAWKRRHDGLDAAAA
ncbi:MAG: hypothetical protein RLY78_2041, partial [Pseudomonadota bacterium]